MKNDLAGHPHLRVTALAKNTATAAPLALSRN
jgi:hypothetical protein